jgi:hypothetical protein
MRRRPPRQQQSANPMVSFLSSLTSHSQAPRNGAQARRKTAVPLRYATPQRAPSRARVSAGGYRPVMPLWLAHIMVTGPRRRRAGCAVL